MALSRALAVQSLVAAASATITHFNQIAKRHDCLSDCRSATHPARHFDFCHKRDWAIDLNACLVCAVPLGLDVQFRDSVDFMASQCGYHVAFLDANGTNATADRLHAIPVPSGNSKPNAPSMSAIAGGIAGMILGLALIFLLFLFFDRRRRRRQQLEEHASREQLACVSEILGFDSLKAAVSPGDQRPVTTRTMSSSGSRAGEVEKGLARVATYPPAKGR